MEPAVRKISAVSDRRMVLSTLWIFLLLNYLYVDLAMVIFRPGAYQKMASQMSQEVVLGFTILIEIPIAMVLFSRVVKYGVNRWANLVAVVVNIAFVVGPLTTGRPPLFYAFVSIIELVTLVFMLWYAWTWCEPVDDQAGRLSPQ
jgi:MFS family permease